MGRPQQEELARSERGETTEEGKRITREQDDAGNTGNRLGPVPEENRPGHRPDEEQDKPRGTPDET